MGSLANRMRRVWQDYGGAHGLEAENYFYTAFKQAFVDTEFEIINHPKDFKHIYENVILPDEQQKRIYNPNKKYIHGLSPDYAIRNKNNGKTLYIEVKRQDGWVEGKEPKAGRGNVHERSCKYFTPGLLALLKDTGQLNNAPLPFWVVFIGDITRDPKRNREIYYWYKGVEDHFFMWDEAPNPIRLIQHFEDKLKQYLL